MRSRKFEFRATRNSMWVMEISNNPGKEEAKPAFKATLIVDNVHLHILPSMNPDGFSLRKRGNAYNIDRNHDFPDQFFPINDDIDKRQPETKAIMRWLKDIRFTASASLHGGALVANYPWDETEDKSKSYYACPDDETFKYMAKVYSGSHFNMSKSEEFESGITNGAQWYPIYGGMQDWNYIFADCFELTLEITDNKWPPVNDCTPATEPQPHQQLNRSRRETKAVNKTRETNGPAASKNTKGESRGKKVQSPPRHQQPKVQLSLH
ncbi:hypothetical protein LXL04_034863 [Taraxacum kok-saghyz]